MTSSFLAPSIVALAGIGTVTWLAGRLVGRRLLRRAGLVTIVVALVALAVTGTMVDRSADCAELGGTMQTRPPMRVEGKAGSRDFGVEFCAIPSTTTSR